MGHGTRRGQGSALGDNPQVSSAQLLESKSKYLPRTWITSLGSTSWISLPLISAEITGVCHWAQLFTCVLGG